ncbi:MAG: DUF2157 domain-containing protein [Steroidobacteraceae bacterium]|nr:DUF2157 domain-containing protein [Steroidobacteraceae bacterium]
MHTLEPELRELNEQGTLDDETASRAVALDRGEVFSLHGELRATLYAGVLLVMAGVGTILARNLDRLGPMVIVLAVVLAASACSVPAVRARLAGRTPGFAADYLLLLAVLLASADLAYAERQFNLLGPLWSWHLLLLAVVGAAIGYTFGSALVIAAALTALAGWFGVGGSVGDALHAAFSTPELGGRALACAALIAAWRFADRHWRPDTRFSEVFNHFFTNLAFWGALAWCLEWPWLAAGLPLLTAFAYASIRRGLETGREAFLVYGVGYAALGICFVVVPRLDGTTSTMAFVLLVVCVTAAALWQLRRRLREPLP